MCAITVGIQSHDLNEHIEMNSKPREVDVCSYTTQSGDGPEKSGERRSPFRATNPKNETSIERKIHGG